MKPRPAAKRQSPQTMVERVRATLDSMPIIDMHTHLFAPQFGELNLWGIDELLTYHYLVAEYFRSSDMKYDEFWALPKSRQADLIWQKLFVENTPVSEGACGVCGVLSAFGLDTRARDLREAREFFASRDVDHHISEIMRLAGVSDIVMTNDPFDPAEVKMWDKRPGVDPRFHAVLRIDPMLNQWQQTCPQLKARGYDVSEDLSGKTIPEMRRFIDEWIERMNPLYMAVSLPDDWKYPEGSVRERLINEVVMPAGRNANLPFATMIGVRRAVNPHLRLAGDGVGWGDVKSLERMAEAFPENRFLATFLSRENQHSVCVSTRKFRNIMLFGCWWFVNNPSLIAEITRERLELLGTSFIPQHSDARILDQLIYKWRHSRYVIAQAMADSYDLLERDGRPVSDDDIRRDVQRMFIDNFRQWTGGRIAAKSA